MKALTNKTIYACDHCGKKYIAANQCKYHEAHKCWENPNNKHKCFFGNGCKNLVKGTREFSEVHYCETVYNYDTFFCRVSEQEMYSYRLSNRMPIYQWCDGERMPLECEHYEENDLPY